MGLHSEVRESEDKDKSVSDASELRDKMEFTANSKKSNNNDDTLKRAGKSLKEVLFNHKERLSTQIKFKTKIVEKNII